MIFLCSAWKRLNTGQKAVASSVVSVTPLDTTCVSSACRSSRNFVIVCCVCAPLASGAAGVPDADAAAGSASNRPSATVRMVFDMVFPWTVTKEWPPDYAARRSPPIALWCHARLEAGAGQLDVGVLPGGVELVVD